jgi:hypothetical protein
MLTVLAGLMAVACLATSPASAAFVNLTPAGGNGSASAGSAVLADLLNDPTGGVIVGDKVFTNFSYLHAGDMPAENQVNVQGIKDASGNWGVRFQGAFLDNPGGVPASDAHIGFTVSVDFLNAQRGVRITDAHLGLNGASTGGDESYFIVDETLSNGVQLETYVTTLGPGNTQQSKLTDGKDFAGVASLNVIKDILASAAEGNFLPARGTVIDQSFSQSVPEPAAMAMLGLSGMALVGVARRRG